MRYLSQFSSSILHEIHEKIGFVALANIFLKVPKLARFTSMFIVLKKTDQNKLIDYIKNDFIKNPPSVEAKSPPRNGFEPTEGEKIDAMLESVAHGFAIYALFNGLTAFEKTALFFLILILRKVNGAVGPLFPDHTNGRTANMTRTQRDRTTDNRHDDERHTDTRHTNRNNGGNRFDNEPH